MKSFLFELAEKIYHDYGKKLETLTLIFPNRRASLYFRKNLGILLDKPSFSPKLITIEDFITGLQEQKLDVPDKLHLIHVLYQVYQEVMNKSSEQNEEAEPFDQFYFWGEMLLRDFDEVDKYMVNADHLFKDLSHQKTLDATFDFLTDEQKDFLKSFWINFDTQDSVNKQKFLYIWRQLPLVYKSFRERLLATHTAYEGMLHRFVADNISKYSTKANGDLIFVGFNALTKAEEVILSHFVSHHEAKVFWDIDAYYIHNNTQEAGKFFREYQQHPVLGKTFPHDIPSHFLEAKKENSAGAVPTKQLHLYGAAQPVGQAKLMAEVIRDQIQKGFVPEETLVVLPDEKMLMPVLHGIAGMVEKLNVTMGFPLTSTPMFNLVELLIELQISRKDDTFNHRAVLALLGHPYGVAADAVAANQKRKEILFHNWIYIPSSFLSSGNDVHARIFKNPWTLHHDGDQLHGGQLVQYLRDIMYAIGSLKAISEFDREFCLHFIKLLNRLDEINPSTLRVDIQAKNGEKNFLKSFLRMFRLLVKTEKIPFTGEPLRGLQVMGVLETRNLDFKNVFILSLNEGAFPSFNNKGSYIPFTIRKAYQLPTTEHQDAMYAYLFYRLLQRAENVFMFYNSETDVLGQGEMSRYLQQLLYESGLQINRYVLHNRIQPSAVTPVVIRKDERVFNALARHCVGHREAKGLTPTALNDYIECRLKFYFRYVARIREAREVEEDLDARVLGNFLHKLMELLYHEILQEKNTRLIVKEDFNGYERRVDAIIDRIFIETYKLDPSKKVSYDGQRLVVKEVVKRFADRIISIDKAYAPFMLEALEKRDMNYSITLDVSGKPEVLLGGIIDRADRKENAVRVIDYKTGKDELQFDSVMSLFNREGRRNKAAFQTMLYALLYHKNMRTPGVKLIPGLMNRLNLFDDDFTFGLKNGKAFLDDATPLLPQFEELLKKLLEELYHPDTPFDQTNEVEICRTCSYRALCYR
jgi:HD superfamily phosphohydrolase YqeK